MYLFITTINTAVKWTIKINDMKISVTNVSALTEKINDPSASPPMNPLFSSVFRIFKMKSALFIRIIQ